MRSALENDRAILLLCLFVVLAGLILGVTPDRQGVSLFGVQLPEVCGVKRLGGSCPGCGLTRSFILGLQGDPAAFRVHPAGPILLLVVLAQIPYRAVRIVRTRALLRAGHVDLRILQGRKLWSIFKTGIVVVLVAGWIVRMWLGGP
jgi:hypothetical protein